MRGAPQVGFSATIGKIRARTSLLTPFRPPTRLNLEIHIQYKRNPVPCQFTTLRGVTKTRGFLHPDQNVLNATQNSLCRAVNRVRGRCACKASSCWRRAKFSRTSSSRERKELMIHPRRCRSDTIMARIVAEKSESSFSQVIHSAGVRRFGERHNSHKTATSDLWNVSSWYSTRRSVVELRNGACDSRKRWLAFGCLGGAESYT